MWKSWPRRTIVTVSLITPHSPAAVRHNFVIESMVGFWWIMFVKVTNSKGKHY